MECSWNAVEVLRGGFGKQEVRVGFCRALGSYGGGKEAQSLANRNDGHRDPHDSKVVMAFRFDVIERTVGTSPFVDAGCAKCGHYKK